MRATKVYERAKVQNNPHNRLFNKFCRSIKQSFSIIFKKSRSSAADCCLTETVYLSNVDFQFALVMSS